jgi:hypothetical protein
MISPSDHTIDQLFHWLRDHNVSNINLTQGREFIVATLSVATAESLLSVSLYNFLHKSTGKTTIRSDLPYSLPDRIASLVDFVGGITVFPR